MTPTRPAGIRHNSHQLERVGLGPPGSHRSAVGGVPRSTRTIAEHQQVEVLARTIRNEQRAEIAPMQRWLRAWFNDGWQHGMGGGTNGAR